jgi:CheY-like chemotaxis protein
MARILVVDDDPTIRAIAQELLLCSGHELFEAADGDEALRVAATMPIDLIVLDMLMPNKDGIETIQAVKRDHPDTRILAISSGGRMDGATLLKLASAFGADETMLKPLRLATFAVIVDALLARDAVPSPLELARTL